MAKNYFIGIGGTGARLGEALIHLCAAGLGPKNLTLFLIDPDQGNGNLARTASLAAAYTAARARFTDRAGDDVVALGTDLRIPDPFVWHIFKDRNVRLAGHVGLATLKARNGALADFASVLFSEDEMETPLDEGFRGHPNIGSLVISDVPDDEDPWKTFWADVTQAQQAGEVQVFLAGSIFGGTGAAGIPTLGAPDVLKHDPRASLGTGSKIRLGAGLVLPYFTFDVGEPPPGQPQMFVTAADFPIATKAALSFYAEKDLAFDDVYLLGDSLGQNVGRFSPGNQNQKNRPHYIELAGALAALDFYESRPAGGGTQYLHAARNNPALGWEDLPVSRDPDAVADRLGLLKQRLTVMTAFAHTVLGYGMPTLRQDVGAVDDKWHGDHFYPRKLMGLGRDRTKDPRQEADRQRLDVVAAYLDRFLEWAAALNDEAEGVFLFDSRQLRTPEGAVPDPGRRPEAIGTFLGRYSDTENQDFTAFKNVLNATDVKDQPNTSVANSDVFVNLFYRAARDFATANYSLKQTASPTA